MKHTSSGSAARLELSPIAYRARTLKGKIQVKSSTGWFYYADFMLTLGRGTFKLVSIAHDCSTMLQWHEVDTISGGGAA